MDARSDAGDDSGGERDLGLPGPRAPEGDRAPDFPRLGYGADCDDVPEEPVAIAVKPVEVPAIGPPVPPFPYFEDRREVITEARRLSCALEAYVKRWLDGEVPAELPEALLPDGRDRDLGTYRLVRAEEIRAEDQWSVRNAGAVDLEGLFGSFQDPYATYIVAPSLYAPFGSRVVLEGEFPHARFFDVQVTPSFLPEAHRYDGAVGVGEIPLVDVDIEPLPGHTNPYRVGADRTAEARGYRVEFDLAMGDPTALEPAFTPPDYRAPGNRRIGGAILFQGPFGDIESAWSHGRGMWDGGSLWIRYYAPDDDAGPLGGVPLPKMHYVLPDGRPYFIQVDAEAFDARVNKAKPARPTLPENPGPSLGGDVGWASQMGIYRPVISGFAIGYTEGLASLGVDPGDLGLDFSPAFVRALDRGVAGRGERVAAPGNYEPSATSA
ncbi:MAG: hypothetical protein AAGH15_25355, partial [Myxococcota bacterium]